MSETMDRTLTSVCFTTLPTAAVKVSFVHPLIRIEESIDTKRYGANVGCCVGRSVGSGDGSRVGSGVGSSVGSRVGSSVGSRVGASVGSRVSVGAEVG